MFKKNELSKLLLVAFLSGMVSFAAFSLFQSHDLGRNYSLIDNALTNGSSDVALVSNIQGANVPIDFREASSKSLHAVVYIETEFTRKSSVYDDYYSIDDFFGRRSPSVLKASGSGVIISADGYIITNNHVVQEADVINITLNDKRSYSAKLIGTDPTTDLALLKIDEKDLEFVVFGNSDYLQVGDWVLAVGNPFNLTSTVTAGIVSAKARNINILGSNAAIESFIQTDAVVNPGNSGGALVNTKGELVGINAAIASRTGSYIGYSFAIPVNIAKKVANDLKEFGAVQRAYLGITIKEINAKLARELQLDTIKGVYVEGILDGGAAKKSNIETGDIIYSINGIDVNSPSELLEKVGLHRPGDKIEIGVVKNKKLKYYDVVLANKNGGTELNSPSDGGNTIIGAKLQSVPSNLATSLGVKNGVQIIELQDGLFKSAGIREGFIITKIGPYEIQTPKDVEGALAAKKGGILIEGIYPNGIRAYYGVGL